MPLVRQFSLPEMTSVLETTGRFSLCRRFDRLRFPLKGARFTCHLIMFQPENFFLGLIKPGLEFSLGLVQELGHQAGHRAAITITSMSVLSRNCFIAINFIGESMPRAIDIRERYRYVSEEI